MVEIQSGERGCGRGKVEGKIRVQRTSLNLGFQSQREVEQVRLLLCMWLSSLSLIPNILNSVPNDLQK